MQNTITKVLGFSVYFRNSDEKYYATKRLFGRQHTVYVGKDIENAETKIKVYCGRRNLPICPPRKPRCDKVVGLGEKNPLTLMKRDVTEVKQSHHELESLVNMLKSKISELQEQNELLCTKINLLENPQNNLSLHEQNRALETKIQDNKQEMIVFILDCLRSGQVKDRQIDEKGGGRAARRLKAGDFKVSNFKICLMYERCEQLTGVSQDREIPQVVGLDSDSPVSPSSLTVLERV